MIYTIEDGKRVETTPRTDVERGLARDYKMVTLSNDRKCARIDFPGKGWDFSLENTNSALHYESLKAQLDDVIG